MRSSYSTPEFTLGTSRDIPVERENTEDRSWGEFAKDVAIDVAAKPVISAARTAAQAWRSTEEPGSEGWGTAVERGLGTAEETVEGWRSPRAKALDTLSPMARGDERDFWQEPFTGAVHMTLPSVGYGLAAIFTGGSSALAQIGTAAAMGAAGAGEAVNEIRNFTDRTDIKELRKLEPFNKLLVQFDGNEKAARDQLFKDMQDPGSMAFNFMINAANFPALKHGLRQSGVSKGIATRAKAAGYGGAEGVVLGAGEGAVEGYIDQIGKVRSGQQENIDTDEIAKGMAAGSTFGAPMAAFHAVAPPAYQRKATPLGTGTAQTANNQINQPGGPSAAQPPAGATGTTAGGPTVPGGVGTAGPTPPVRPRGPVTDIEEVTGEEAPPVAEVPTPPPSDQAAPHPAVQATGMVPPDVQDATTIFKTGKGSEYFAFDDGTTIRNKAPRPEHPGDQGWKDRSQQTFYVTPEHANQLSLLQATTTLPKRLGIRPNGTIGVQYKNGSFERRTVGRPLAGPQVGAIPVEIWQNGTRFHFGNPITEVAQRPPAAGAQAAPGEPAAAQTTTPGVPAAAPAVEAAPAAGPAPAAPAAVDRAAWLERQLQTEQDPTRRAWLERQLQQERPPQGEPPRMPTRRAVWSTADERGFRQVFVLDRPPLWREGQWHQPVVYVDPAGRRRMMLAPVDELHTAYGPERPTKPAREPEAPPVVTPEQPLPPQFPEVEAPGLPQPGDFGEEARAGKAVPLDIDKGRAVASEGMPSQDRNLIRGAAAGWSTNQRAELGQTLAENYQQRRVISIGDVPSNLRVDLDRAEYAALDRGLREFPQETIDIIRRPPATVMGESGVLQDLQQRLARRQQEKGERQKSIREQREEQLAARQAAMMKEPVRREVEALRKMGKPGPRRPWTSPAELRERRIANRKAAMKREVEQRRTTVSEQLKERVRAAKAETAEVVRKTVAEEPERHAARRGTTHPLLGTPRPITEQEAMTERERTLAADVAKYNKRINQPMFPAQRQELEVDRRVLEERIAKFNATAGERGLTPLKLDVPTPKVPVAKQETQRFNSLVDQVRKNLQHGSAARELFRQMEAINEGRKGAHVKQLPVPTDLYNHALKQGWIKTKAQEQADYERVKLESDALRAMQTATLNHIFGRPMAARRGDIRGERRQVPTYMQLSEAGRAKLRAYLANPNAPLPDNLGIYGERAQAAWKARRAAPGREATDSLVDLRARQKKEGRRHQDPIVSKEGEEFFPPMRRPVDLLDRVSRLTEILKTQWERLPDAEKTEARRGELVTGAQEMETLIRQAVARRHEQARQREAAGKDPVRRNLDQPSGWENLPTEDEAIAQFREEQLKQALEEERLRNKAAQEERDAELAAAANAPSTVELTNAERVQRTRARQAARREEVIKTSLKGSITKEFQDLLDRMGQRTVTVTLREPWPTGRERTVELDLDRRPRRPDDILADNPVDNEDRRDALWNALTDAWRDAKVAKVELAGQLKPHLEKAIDKVEQDIIAYRAAHGIKGRSISWSMPKAFVVKKTGRTIYRGGKDTPEFAHFNYLTDLRNMDEGIRFMQIALGLRDPPGTKRVVDDAARQRMQRLLGRSNAPATTRPGRVHATAESRATSTLDEFTRYTRPLSVADPHEAGTMGSFIDDVRSFLKDDMAAIRDKRQGRTAEATDWYKGLTGGKKGTIDRDLIDLGDYEPQYITGGSKAALSGRNVVEDAAANLGSKYREILEQREVARQGGNITVEDLRKLNAEKMQRDFPVKWTSQENLRKARRGMAFDAEGLPANRMRHEEFEPYTAEQQAAVDAYVELNEPLGEPSHPLISPPETTRDLIERLKSMRDKGQALDLPHDYINDDFLNMLADVTEGTTVYHAPYDVVSGISDSGPAFYQALADRIALSSDISPESYAHAALHEPVHAATDGMLSTDPQFYGEVRDLLIRSVRQALARGINLDKLPRDFYGLNSPSEYLAESVSNQKFREFLFGVPAPHSPVIQGIKNAINALYAAIQRAWRRVTGKRNADTALDVLFYDQSTVLGQTDALIKRSFKKLRTEGRPAYDQAYPTDRNREKIGDRYYLSLSGGARAFRDGLTKRAADAGYTETQARNLPWYSVADMTNVGSAQFKELTADFHRFYEEMHGTATKLRDEDKREIAEMAKIWNSWNKEGRENAGAFMIAEGMHTAWVDAPLGERDGVGRLTGKNAHIDPDHLNFAQVQQEHGKLQTGLAELADNLPRFAEFRQRTYDFTAKREQEVRRNRIRDIMRLSDFVPEQLKGKAREDVIDAFEHWADTEQKMSPQDMKVLRDAGVRLNDPKILDFIKDVRAEKTLSKIQGPYSPFTRYGDWAISGRFRIETPANAITLAEDIDDETGLPIEDTRYVFKTEKEARKMVADITQKFGLAQMGGGRIWIDTSTGRRPVVPDRRNAGQTRQATGRDIESLLKKGEMPLKEYYYVQFQPKILEMHPSQAVANRNREELKKQYGDSLDITEPKDVFRHDGRQNEFYTSATMQRIINQTRASAAFQRLDRHEKAAVTREWNLAAEVYALRHGPRERYLQRNYVKGATTHVLASLDDYSRSSSRFVAKMRHHGELKYAEEAMRAYLKDYEYAQGDRNALAEQRVADALIRRLHNPTRDPHENIVSRSLDRFMRYTMLDKLPGMAYFMTNATEPVVLGAPLMMGRHGVATVVKTMAGMYRVAKAIRFAQAAKRDVAQALKRGTEMTDFRELFADAVKNEPDVQGLVDLLTRAAKRNMFDATASLEYQSSFGTSRKIPDVVLDWAQGVFQAMNTSIENMNRFVTLGTAYRLEMARLTKAGGLDAAAMHEAAVNYALTISHQANGVYANYNAPEMFTREGPLGMFGPVVFQFKKWPQRVIMIYARAALGTLRGLAQLSRGEKMSDENKERARQLVYMLAMTGLVAGALGMPTEPFSVPVNMAFMMGISSYNWDDAQAGFRAWAAKTFGQEAGQVISHGPLSYLTGWDVGSRLGQENMIAFGSPASNQKKDLYASAVGLLGGASLGTASEIWQGFQKVNEGRRALAAGADDLAYKKFGEATKLLMPVRQFSDLVGAANGMEGTTLASGRKMGQPYTAWETAGRAVGFVPTREAEAREGRSAITGTQKRIMAQRNEYIQEFVQSPPGQQAERVWETIQREWNASHPGQEITRSDLLKAKRTRTKAENEPRSQLGLPVDRRVRPLLPMAEAYGFR